MKNSLDNKSLGSILIYHITLLNMNFLIFSCSIPSPSESLSLSAWSGMPSPSSSMSSSSGVPSLSSSRSSSSERPSPSESLDSAATTKRPKDSNKIHHFIFWLRFVLGNKNKLVHLQQVPM